MGRSLDQWVKQTAPMPPTTAAMLNLSVAARAIEHRFGKLLLKHGLTQPQYNALRILRGVFPDGHPRSEISARMFDRSPDMTRLIDRLVRMSYVQRKQGIEDRRESIACITSKGLTLLKKLDPLVERFIEEEFAKKFTQAEILEISRLCERTYENEL